MKIIAGLILSFSLFTPAGSFLLTALVLPQDFPRWAGLIVLSIIGAGLIFPTVEEVIERPFARLPKINRRGADGNSQKSAATRALESFRHGLPVHVAPGASDH